MKQEHKDALIFILLVVVKLLTTARTAIDTYTVSGDLLNVALIDITMLGMWLVAAYGGTSKTALATRPIAALIAWVLYLGQLYIGIEATHSVVSVFVRIAGGMALGFDTYSYIVNLTQRKGKKSVNQRRYTLRQIMLSIGYYVASILLTPMTGIIGGAKYISDVVDDVKHTPTRVNPPVNQRVNTVQGVIVSTPVKQLTPGERQDRVKALHLQGVSKAQIARELNVSRQTIYKDFEVLGL